MKQTKSGTPGERRRGSSRTRAAALTLGAVAGLVIPVAIVGAASASTTVGLCTVTPQTPVANGTFDASNRPYVDYKVTVTCDPGRSVELTQQRWEKDFSASEGGDDMFDSSTRTIDFTNAKARKTKTWTVTDVLPSMDGPDDDYAEVYQKVSFVVTASSVPSAPTSFESSGYRSIHQ